MVRRPMTRKRKTSAAETDRTEKNGVQRTPTRLTSAVMRMWESWRAARALPSMASQKKKVEHSSSDHTSGS